MPASEFECDDPAVYAALIRHHDRFIPIIKLEHEDSRGEIYSIELPNGHELMLLHSTPGSFRGGHSHTCEEVVMLLSGQMMYHKKWDGDPGEWTERIRPGECPANEAGEIHMGEFLEDTWLVEFKLAPKGSWEQADYEPYRRRVRDSLR